MSRRHPFTNLIVGPNEIESRVDYKFAVLRGQLGFLMGFICLIYIPIDLFNGVSLFLPWYGLGIGFSTLIIYLNRTGRYKASTLILLLVTNLLIYFFAAVDNPNSGVFFFFMAAASMGIIFFYQVNWLYALFFALFSLSLALLSYIGDWSPIPPPLQTPEHIETNFITNLILGMVSSSLVLIFVMKRNKESERTLIKQQNRLEELAEQLEISKNRFEQAVEGSSAGIYEWHIKDNGIYVSPQWLKLLGYQENEVVVDLEFYMQLIHPEDAQRAGERMQKAFMGTDPYHNELRLKKKDGSYHWFLDSGIVKFRDDDPDVAVGSIKDINDRKLAEKELQSKNTELGKINSELDRFVYSASHDMRAPLSTLLGLIQLAEISEDRDEMKTYFRMMTERIHTMEGFIKEVTDFSRNARLELEYHEVNLFELIGGVTKSFNILSRDANVKVDVNVDPKHTIVSDTTRLTVIFNNLLANAIKYHDKSKEIRWVKVDVKCKEDYCEIHVEDNGVGIETDHQEKVFDMFYRASENSDGSGLGLYIVRETLQKLGGRIGYKSTTGEGTLFKVELPYKRTNGNKIPTDPAELTN